MAFSSDSVNVFLAVLDHGSFSAAARALSRVPSAVSMTIAHLEAELDVRLFDRGGREPQPTAAARALEPQARLLAAQLRQLNAQALALTQGLEERLTIAIAPELLTGPWTEALAALTAEYPQLQAEVLAAPQADAMALLHAGRAQLALVFERSSLDGREGFQEVGSETLVAVIAPQHPVMQAAAGAPLSEAHLTTTRQIVVAGRDLAQTDPRFVFARHHWRTDNHLAALRLIEAGLGWGWQPRELVEPGIQAGTLMEMPFDNLSNGVELWVDVVWSKERPQGLGARRFVEWLRQAAQAPAGRGGGGGTGLQKLHPAKQRHGPAP
ncbi:LysR family transcriptional regulator [Paracidovorax citrulli]|uniref:Transcriptional regulator, LysR family n=2 Tax=Paracidovorax citrulli TaxID=80869 RepID=A1TIL9_PARC0|nr:LysR family transcriptional regulator [Paracidovorax citrulli]ABM30807.1 transcriptional regulator, LysR family [Paracidovorax citrulli AAC00-1]ATG96012.1 LysR family transcriptional regulator [Paracidovorax citrulli]PVY64979.1 DNA-binding transcriptional LysR family regulator [Paracidovorax citrulli]REG70828.1 DNA-binding transcriptional LysR family regulator [Paracidovorax citrulli]RLJ95380.1 DNA-binding transcriptional LysR family regulator [Paracidovorax citrulli]